MIAWQSAKLYEHPSEPAQYGRVTLNDSRVYTFNQGNLRLACSQAWATKIHYEENGGKIGGDQQ